MYYEALGLGANDALARTADVGESLKLMAEGWGAIFIVIFVIMVVIVVLQRIGAGGRKE